MTIPKLNSREKSHLGLRGEAGSDYVCRGDVIEVKLFSAFLADNPDQAIDVAHPGDLVVIWSQTQFAMDNTCAVAEAHPDLLKSGFCSFPRVLFDTHHGPVSILFRCEQEISIVDLPYIVALTSLGTCKH